MISDYMRENPEFEYIIDMGRDSYTREFNEWWGNYDWQGFGTTKFEGEILEEDWFIKIIRRYKNECNINNYKDFNRFSKLIYIYIYIYI